MNANIDSYEYFGISSNPNIAELKELYKGMAKKCHPDAGGTQDEFIELKKHYELLKDCLNNQKVDYFTVNIPFFTAWFGGEHKFLYKEKEYSIQIEQNAICGTIYPIQEKDSLVKIITRIDGYYKNIFWENNITHIPIHLSYCDIIKKRNIVIDLYSKDTIEFRADYNNFSQIYIFKSRGYLNGDLSVEADIISCKNIDREILSNFKKTKITPVKFIFK
jgi:curved DNA-binding protein CbpA